MKYQRAGWIGLVLSVLLFFYSGGLWLFFPVTRNAIQKQRWEKLERETQGDRIVLRIPVWLTKTPNPVFQKIDDREIRYQGQLYDVVFWREKGDTLWLYAYHDKKESDLVNEMAPHLEDHSNTFAQPSYGMIYWSYVSCPPVPMPVLAETQPLPFPYSIPFFTVNGPCPDPPPPRGTQA